MATALHVLLQSDVDNLGSGGDVVKVRPGFARNYLLPRGLAVPATPANMARVEELKKLAAERKAAELKASNDVAQKLQAVSVKLERAVGEENKMYGSVTTKDIEEAYAAIGIEIDRKKIHLAEPIKSLGAFEVPIKLHNAVTANLRVEVIKKG
jgi:large subunit ribosomal protein L9